MFRLAHISDVHLSPLPPVPASALVSKRITGYLNWKMNRKGAMGNKVLEELIKHLRAAQADHIAVTGDLVNLALEEEIENAARWLHALGQADDVSVVPGNHDAYVRGALKRAVNAWKPFIGDGKRGQPEAFPYRRDRGPVALIGVNSAIATPPFMATGRFEEKQKQKTEELLEQAKREGLYRVVMIHHPPFPNATHWHKQLRGEALFRSMIKEVGAELVLHGHTHVDSFQLIDGPQQPVPVIGVPSASKAPSQLTDEKHTRPAGRYNLFSIDGPTNAWNCTFADFGFEKPGDSVHQIQERPLMVNGKTVTA